MVTEEDRRSCRPSVPKDREKCHNQILGEISRVGSTMTCYAKSVIQLSSLPEALYGLLKCTLVLLHSLYSSYCNTGSLQELGEMQQTLSSSHAFSSQVTARSGGNT